VIVSEQEPRRSPSSEVAKAQSPARRDFQFSRPPNQRPFIHQRPRAPEWFVADSSGSRNWNTHVAG